MIVKINKSIKLFKQILYESNQIKRTKQMKELNKFNQIKNFLFALFSHETTGSFKSLFVLFWSSDFLGIENPVPNKLLQTIC